MYISIGFLLITLHMTSIIIVRGPDRITQYHQPTFIDSKPERSHTKKKN